MDAETKRYIDEKVAMLRKLIESLRKEKGK